MAELILSTGVVTRLLLGTCYSAIPRVSPHSAELACRSSASALFRMSAKLDFGKPYFSILLCTASDGAHADASAVSDVISLLCLQPAVRKTGASHPAYADSYSREAVPMPSMRQTIRASVSSCITPISPLTPWVILKRCSESTHNFP